ncbi:hypothetical protein Ahia01_000132900 [Argonauta hians]
MNEDMANATESIPSTPVGLVVPPFYKHDPELWFAILENQMTVCGITSNDDRLNHAIANLTLEALTEVRELVVEPQEKVSYYTFKNELIKRTNTSQNIRLIQLLAPLQLGDRKPTQLLQEMRELQEEEKHMDYMPQDYFLKKLPVLMQDIVNILNKLNTSLEKIAKVGDKIAGAVKPSSSQSSESLSSGRRSSLGRLCWYHYNFGIDAHKCQFPCSF